VKKNNNLKIGFFGDSFCEEMGNPHSLLHGYDTYIKLLKKQYNAKIVNLGKGGSSIWDVVLNQFPPFMEDLPDVTIFVWTDLHRIYHKKVRNMTYTFLKETRPLPEITVSEIFNPGVIKAGKLYLDYLFDIDKAELEYKSLLYYFDHEVLSKIKTNTKIIHLWSFEKRYDWKNGKEIETPLMSFADPIWASNSLSHWVPNHIAGKENLEVFNLIKHCVDTFGKDHI
jgi:hypothetical protein